MCSRNLVSKIACVVFVFVLCVCHTDGRVRRLKRDHTATHTNGSGTVGDMVNNILANLFGQNTSLTDVADKKMNDSTKQALQSFLTNVSQSLTSTNETDTGTNLQAQQQDVTTQETNQLSTTDKPPTTTLSATSTPTTTSSLYSTSSSWMLSSSATESSLEDNRCYTDAILQNYCSVPKDMTDVSFWDLYSVFFSDSVLDALMYGCTKGSWCLKDRFDYWEALIVERVDMIMESEIATSMCGPGVEPCIVTVANNFYNCSMYSQMVFTSEVLKLICGLKQKSYLTETCYKHVITALHVTLADLLRTKENNEDEDDVDTCEAPEAEMTKGLICVENSCPGESNTFHSFKPWAWFTSVVNDLIVDCNFDPTTCRALLMPPEGMEMGILVGISVAVMVTALTLMVVVCTCYKRHRRNAVVKEGYQRLLTDGDES